MFFSLIIVYYFYFFGWFLLIVFCFSINTFVFDVCTCLLFTTFVFLFGFRCLVLFIGCQFSYN